MSFEYYSKWSAGTRKNLERLAAKDEEFVKVTDKNVKTRPLANQLVGGLYSKYCMIIQDLGVILDQLAQPQKRITVRKLMDVATIRLHELNEELRTIDISEYHYIDGALIELKLIPQDIEILSPILYFLRDYTVEDLWTKIKNGERIYTPPPPPSPPPESEVEEVTEQQSTAPTDQNEPAAEATAEEDTKKKQKADEEDEEKKEKKKLKIPGVRELTEEEKAEIKRKEWITSLVKIIQTNERGRQARIYFMEKYSEFLFRKKVREGYKPVPIDPKVQEASARMVQTFWQGHCIRQLMKRKELERRYLIGMYEPSWKSNEEFEKLERNLQIRRDLRDQRIKEYIAAHLNERTRVFTVIGPRLMEDISDEIREWFYQWYTQVKNFDKYPTEEQGGTVIVIRGETLTPKEWIDEVEKKRKEKAKAKGKDKAKLKAEKAKKKKEEAARKKKAKDDLKKELLRKKKKREKPWEFELEYEATTTKEPYATAFSEYRTLFNEKKDEDNPEEKHYMDMIHEEKCLQMQMELRVIVDEMMRLELQMLLAAQAKDRKKKYKPPKAKKKKRKGKGKRKGKDMTASRTTEDLFQELVDNGIIRTYKPTYLKDYIGDFSYKNWELRNRDFDPPATLGDVRQAVKINCIAPLSTESMKKPRSVLLLGPRQSGKHLLANAVFTESQSVLFDLSPEVLVGKYPGAKGMKMLLHLINKMSRLLQPSVIYFDAAEKIFYKKVPKEEKPLDPTRMGKKLYKGIVKTIKPEDRVLVFSITGKPWLAKAAKIKKTFEQIILMPRPDYGSVYMYWRELLMPYHGIDRNINLSCLTNMTVYFTLPDLKKAVETVLTPRRIIQLSYNPLKQSELLEVLIDVQPVTDKEYKKYQKLYGKVPLAKERKRLNTFNEKKRAAEANSKKR